MSVVAETMNDIQGSKTSNGSAMPVTTFTLETFFISALYFASALISVFGNILVMLAVCTNRRLQTTSNYLLVALAVPDFFQGAVSLPLRLVEVLKAECDHQSFCRASIHVSALFGGASNLHILLIATERFISIYWPYFYSSWVTTKRALLGVCVTWLWMVIFSLLPAMGWGAREPENSVTFCRFPAFLTQEYISFLFVFVHFIPIITVTFLTTLGLKEIPNLIRSVWKKYGKGKQKQQGKENPHVSWLQLWDPLSSWLSLSLLLILLRCSEVQLYQYQLLRRRF